MIRTLKNKHAITLRIAEVLKEKGENWVEEVLQLIGWFNGSMPAESRVSRRASGRRHATRMSLRSGIRTA
ncbi:MAG TPA: hypothetical protein VHO02_00380 [Fibrobacteria bacterium]|nr:hypothetical protein [Fibrobacteria bacterium]